MVQFCRYVRPLRRSEPRGRHAGRSGMDDAARRPQRGARVDCQRAFRLARDRRGLLLAALLVAGLVVMALYYLYLLFLLGWRRKDAATVDDFVPPPTPSCATCLCDVVSRHFSSLDAESRPYLKVSEELPEIAYQTMLLAALMVRGAPLALVACWAMALALNCFVRCYRVCARGAYHERYDSLANAAFQFLFAVAFPTAQLVAARASFAIDRASYALRVDYIERGAFERLARFAQPEAFTSTHTTARPLLELLLLGGDASLAVATLGLHLALLWHAHDVVLGCLLGFKRLRVPMTSGAVHDDSLLSVLRIVKAVYWLAIKLLLACLCVSKRLIPKVFALVLFIYGVGVLVVTGMGVAHSRAACEPVAGRCVLQAFTFEGFTKDKYAACPCIIYVNQPEATGAMTWSQWSQRADVTEELRVVAAAGRLQVIQVVDRDLATLPDGVGGYSDLREFVLVRTALRALPSWLVKMDKLQLLHLAGDVNSTLDAFPMDTAYFERMTNLQSLRLEHLRSLSTLTAFPDNGALEALRSVVLIDLPLVRSLPLMGQLHALRDVVLAGMAGLQRLPLLPDGLTSLRVEMPTALCCNGYLGDSTCVAGNATNASASPGHVASCRAHAAETNDSIECLASDTLNTTQTAAMQRWLRTSSFQCSNATDVGDFVINAISRGAVAACDGQLNLECSLTWTLVAANTSDSVGMCLGAARLQVAHCAPKDPRYEALRRGELRVAGTAQRWLGCGGARQ